MISSSLYNHIFPNAKKPKCDSSLIQQCQKTLQTHNMITKESDYVDDISFKLPDLKGKDIQEHFKIVGEEQSAPYVKIIEKLIEQIPPAPKTWVMREGWTRYAPDSPPEPVHYPLENGVVFDVEVCVNAGKMPTLATAVSDKAWYGWVSSSLINGFSKPVTSHQYPLDTLIPFESSKNDSGSVLNDRMRKPKVVVGHNVSYDRARIKEQYWLNRTGTRFVDTMSLHICIGGLTSYQRAVLKSNNTDDNENDENDLWKSHSSLNSLSEVHKLYCGNTVEKETRNVFVEGSLKEIQSDFQNVMNYCSNDVRATYDVLCKLFPMFLERFPHPVTFAGMLELSTAYLPVNSNWNRYVENSEQTYDDLEIESRLLLMRRAEQACQLLHDKRYKDDIWMWDQDWTVKDLRFKTRAKESAVVDERIDEDEDAEMTFLRHKFQYLYDTKNLLYRVQSILCGYPNWYKKLCTKPGLTPDWVPGM